MTLFGRRTGIQREEQGAAERGHGDAETPPTGLIQNLAQARPLRCARNPHHFAQKRRADAAFDKFGIHLDSEFIRGQNSSASGNSDGFHSLHALPELTQSGTGVVSMISRRTISACVDFF